VGWIFQPCESPEAICEPWENRDVKDMGMGQNLVPLVNIKIAGKWMFIPLKMGCIGIDP